jgi:predicted nucleic acid-binding protein
VVARFVDSNILLRYFTDDIPPLARAAEEIIEADSQLAISAVVLSEVWYVLRKEYGRAREDVLDVLLAFLQRDNVDTVDARKEYVLASLGKARGSAKLSFGDALILAQMRTANVTEIYSFDKDFRDPAIEVFEAPVSH